MKKCTHPKHPSMPMGCSPISSLFSLINMSILGDLINLTSCAQLQVSFSGAEVSPHANPAKTLLSHVVSDDNSIVVPTHGLEKPSHYTPCHECRQLGDQEVAPPCPEYSVQSCRTKSINQALPCRVAAHCGRDLTTVATVVARETSYT